MVGSSHIWKASNCKLEILRPADGNTMCPSPSTPTCSLLWSCWIYLKVWSNAEVVLLDHWLFLPPLHSSTMRNEREFSIVPAVMETNDYSSSVSLEYKLPLGNVWPHSGYLCCYRWAEQASVFRDPTFPLMCVIIALTFPMGARVADHMISPSPLCFLRNHSRHRASLLWGSHGCLDIYLFGSLFVTVGHLYYGWHLRQMTDGVKQAAAHENITDSSSVLMLLRSLPTRIRKCDSHRHRRVWLYCFMMFDRISIQHNRKQTYLSII